MSDFFEYKISPLKIEDLKITKELIYNVFMEFEAPDFSEEGVKKFVEFLEADSMKNMLQDNIINIWGCYEGKKIVGVIAARQMSHLFMLFVHKEYHRKGIGRRLFNTLLCVVNNEPNIKEITVNSSPYAVEFYHKLGFEDTDSEQNVNGIRFTPMKLKI